MSSKLRACVIGATGGWYKFAHHPSLQRLSDRVELAAASSRSSEGRDVLTSQMGFERAYGDVDEMLDKEKPDFALVCLGVGGLVEMGCKVIERGIPLIMEKPVGRSVAEGRQMLEVVEKAGVPHMVAWNRRFNPLLLRVKELMAERGGVSQITCEFLRNDVKAPTWIMGSSVHSIDAMRFLGGDVKSFVGAGSATRYFDERMTAASFALSFESGVIGSFTFNVRAGRSYERYRIMGENWTATVSLGPPGAFDDRWWMTVETDNRETEYVRIANLEKPQICPGYTNGFWGENEHFVECIESGRTPFPDVAESIRSMELGQKMLEAVAPPEQLD